MENYYEYYFSVRGWIQKELKLDNFLSTCQMKKMV